MKLSEVFPIDSDIDIKAIMFDSRRPTPDSIFFAMKGKINDGHLFIDKAIANGAICIVYSDGPLAKKDGVQYIQSDDVYEAYVSFSNAFYGHPADRLKVIGITGTNGKTTIAWILRSIIAHYHKCGYIGTMGYSYGEQIMNSDLNLTSPKSDEFFRICKEMADNGCESLVLEASSEGLLTGRLDQVSFSSAVFNNLTRDHMDIHGDMESYFAAKCLLFDKLKADGVAIINHDDEYGQRLEKMVDRKMVTYGIDNAADYQALNLKLQPDRSEFDLRYKGNDYHVVTNMVARFNIYNLLAIIAVLNVNGYPLNEIIPYLANVELTPGRCQLVEAGQDFNVIVDFAFTPNSFDKVFSFAESITARDGKIIAVFGAAGDRDHLRRPGTAEIADARADLVILTYDDPSTEDMLEILKDLKHYFVRLDPEIILDRIEAINKAVDLCSAGDTLLLLGKGSDHFFLGPKGREPYLSDEAAVRQAIGRKQQE